jgi:hypothetical protein
MILRRRDDYQRVLAELGGQLFAVRGDVERYFNDPVERLLAPLKLLYAVDRRERIQDRIAQHILSGPEREQAALRLANSR